MSVTLERRALDAVQALVTERLGITVDAGRVASFHATLLDLARAAGCDGLSAYLQRLCSPAGARAELRAIAARVTVGETYFFRYPEQLRALRDVALPARAEEARREELRALAAGRAPSPAARPLRILSAGCASGEEAYSLAIVAREANLAGGRPIEITAVDLNPALIAQAREARYTAWSLRETERAAQRAYFDVQPGGELALKPELRAMVTFEERNLLDDDDGFWSPGRFDVVFCRNVLIYFSPEATRALVARLERSLAPGGYLFLGHAETLRGLSHGFRLEHACGAFYYCRRRPEDRAPRPWPSHPAQAVADALGPAAWAHPALEPAATQAWVEVIQGAAARVERLACAAAPASGGAGRGPERPVRVERAGPLGSAMELFRRERFVDAMDALQGASGAAEDADALLLRAVLLTNRGDIGSAERICAEVLADDDLSAGAHYLLALCRAHDGDHAGAVEHHQTAVYLDPSFSMPHLQLGLLAKRSGDLDAAARELACALALLDGEDASRLLLFGGGFSRDALRQLCRKELRACRGAR